MANNPKKEPQYKNSTMPGFLISIYLILMFSAFLLFLTDKYGHARTDKYYLYLGLSAFMIVGVIVASLMDYFEEKRIHKCTLRFMPMSAADISFLCFFGFAAISTLVSDYTKDAFFGIFHDEVGRTVGGRNNGLLLLAVYLLVYLAVTRRYIFKDYVIAVYLAFSSVVAMLAILNYFYIDLLGIYVGYLDSWELFSGSLTKAEGAKPEVILNFGSTLGNKNLISSFMCLFLPVALMTFVLCKKRYLRILGGVSLCIAYCGMLCADSTSGILGMMVLLPVMAIFASRKYKPLKLYMAAMAIMFVSGKLVWIFSVITGGRNKPFEFPQSELIFGSKVYFAVGFFALLFVLLQVFESKLEPHYPKKTVTITLIVLTAGGFIAAIGAFIYYSFINVDADLGENLSRMLRFDEHWGTHRGYYWIKSMDEYGKFSFVHKLFGTGPDTAYAVMLPYFTEMEYLFNEGSTDCLHNEFLNYFVTQGALGLLSYLALIGTVTVRAIRRFKNNPMIMIFLSAVICYAAQSIVNIYQPITTPVFFLFLTLTEALNRQTPVKTSESSNSVQ